MVEHFKIWVVEQVESVRGVKLQGQFDRDNAWGATTDSIQLLGNPVNKNHHGIQDARSHLVGYRVKADVPQPRRWVDLNNQFGTEHWVLADPAILLLPAHKTFPPQSPPPLDQTIDHYICYTVVEGQRRPQPCTLQDQFDQRLQREERIDEIKPALFGVPISKNGGKIVDPDSHLAIYDILPQDELKPPFTVLTLDQFRSGRLTALRSVMLAVPSKKLGWHD